MPRIRHGTLEPLRVGEVNLGVDVGQVEVMNVDGGGELYFRVDGLDPQIGGDDCYVVPAISGASLDVKVTTQGATVVKLVSTGGARYAVMAEV